MARQVVQVLCISVRLLLEGLPGGRRLTHGQANADVVDAHERGRGPGAGLCAVGL